MKLRFRLLLEWLLVAIIGTSAVIAALQWRGTASFDNLFYDQLSGFGRPAADTDILLVTIDQPSLTAIGKWPWPRETHARLIEKLQVAGARSILLDVLLSEPGNTDGDEMLANAMRGKTPVYVPLHFETPGSDGRAYDTQKPVAPIAAAAAGIGHVNVEFDNDGTVRRTALCFSPDDKGARWPHIAELVHRKGGGPSPAYSRLISCDRTLLIPYADRGSYAEIPYVDLLQGQVPAGLIAGRDVIIGATAAGMGDNFPGPFGDGGLISGAEIMANMIGALKRDDFISPVGTPWSIILSLLPMWVLLVGFLRWQPRTALLVSLSLVALVLAGTAAALGAQLWFAPGASLLGMLFVYPLWGWRRLQAMSDFMASEIGELEREGEAVPVPLTSDRASDLVGRQSAALAGAIDHLRDLRRFVSDSLEHLPDPMFVTNTDDVVTLVNHVAEQRLPQDITGLKLSQLIDNFVRPQHQVAVRAYVERRPDAADEFVRFLTRDGRSFIMRSADILDDSDIVRGRIYYLADLTELARAEADREEALQLLSHDMRAPQSAIISMLPELEDDTTRTRIENHARRTMQLAQDFVDIARMGESPFDGIDVLLPDLARDVSDSLWPLARERKITIEIVDATDGAFVCAEPDGLSRAITNLLDNAIKYAPTGSRIDVAISRLVVEESPMINLSVSDHGDGIAEDLLPRLFTRFAAQSGGETRVKSTGLGLAFVKAVAERHRGTVTAENIERGGARFTLSLREAMDPDA